MKSGLRTRTVVSLESSGLEGRKRLDSAPRALDLKGSGSTFASGLSHMPRKDDNSREQPAYALDGTTRTSDY